MAAGGGPSQRKHGVSNLVYSTLGPSLGLLPDQSRDDWVVVGEEERAAAAEGASVAGVAVKGKTSSREKRQSASEKQLKKAEKEAKRVSGDVGSILGQLYANSGRRSSSGNQMSRLNFTSKSGAGILESTEQATASAEYEPEVPQSPVSKQLKNHVSPKNSLAEPPSASTPR